MTIFEEKGILTFLPARQSRYLSLNCREIFIVNGTVMPLYNHTITI